jgi:hypothetical protein
MTERKWAQVVVEARNDSKRLVEVRLSVGRRAPINVNPVFFRKEIRYVIEPLDESARKHEQSAWDSGLLDGVFYGIRTCALTPDDVDVEVVLVQGALNGADVIVVAIASSRCVQVILSPGYKPAESIEGWQVVSIRQEP